MGVSALNLNQCADAMGYGSEPFFRVCKGTQCWCGEGSCHGRLTMNNGGDPQPLVSTMRISVMRFMRALFYGPSNKKNARDRREDTRENLYSISSLMRRLQRTGPCPSV